MPAVPTLFTRRQIGSLTKVPDDVLNYWMRENVLVPREGGEGRGQHRKFDAYEVNLAALLDQVRSFGLSLPAMKRLADRFHDARAYMEDLGITRSNYDPLMDLILIKRRADEDGSAQVFLRDDVEYPGLEVEIDDYPYGRGSKTARVTLQQALDCPETWIGRGGARDPQEIAEHGRRIIDRVDPTEFSAAWAYWSLLTMKVTKEPDVGDGYSAEPDFLYRDSAGDWHITPNISVAKAAIAFIGINVDAINWRTWHGTQPDA